MGDDLTTSEVARLFGVSPETVKNWAKKGKIQCTRTEGGHRRYNRRKIYETAVRLGFARRTDGGDIQWKNQNT